MWGGRETGWVSDSTREKSLPLLVPQLPYITRFDVTRRKWRICCVNMTFDLLLIPYSIRMTVEAADDSPPLKPAALTGEFPSRPSRAGSL